ncbi:MULTISPECIES: leucyl/phenylalanyl-tRNA--protein transferase [unclassified Vibrio]|uniref:Leucyl/phenylalanyl-tRNA--protein transferase n=1 Tax=Vibrio sp. HB236076 TaxID=3232307 RepID=A0AB39HIU9_9VIBR|nr:leucyl/phenylalanyl-tRNA--protein transferase [Vibrio sp. HB161653]MDP5255067.1 leucyl/phenylalanyl-tRNA--protein transferase [Vibrio sp. HB161653]
MAKFLTELSRQHYDFPNPELAWQEPDGLLAFGGDLSPKRLITAYQQGIFPWFSAQDPFLWWSPSVRAYFDPKTFTPAKSLKKFQRKHQYQVTFNLDTEHVIRQCANTRSAEETWITTEMQEAYVALAQRGHCQSVEVWQDQQLIGGFYGLTIGQVFCGESMFSIADNASKIALWYFCHHFAHHNGKMIDCQMMNPHLESLGAQPLSRSRYLALLLRLKDQPMTASYLTPQTLQGE